MCCSAPHSRLLLFSDLDHSEGAGSEGWHFLLALVLKLVLACFSVASLENSTQQGHTVCLWMPCFHHSIIQIVIFSF